MAVVASEKTAAFLSGIERPQNIFQAEAYDRVMDMDFPTTREEYWKYTRVGKIANTSFTTNFNSLTEISLNEHLISEQYLIIENGVFRPDLSQFNNADYSVSSNEISSGSSENSPSIFSVMNTALSSSEISISIEANKVNETALQLVFFNHGEQIISNPRIAIQAGKFSSASISMTFIGLDEHTQFNNMIAEVSVDENAKLTIDNIQNTNESHLGVYTLNASQEKDSMFKVNTVTLKGLLQRNNINIAVKGTNCETHMNGAVVSKGKQHVDNHTFVDHQVSNCFSNENYKYVLDENSTGVFNGRVVVQKDAQVINAYQNNGNILLSENASINSKPELEIYADDVKCSHGSTTGQLDEEALFYLQARGISKTNARKLLVSAFVGEVIEAVEDENSNALINGILKDEYGWDF